MFEPVTITSSIVTPGCPTVCGVGVGSCASAIMTEQRTAAMIARHSPVPGNSIRALIGERTRLACSLRRLAAMLWNPGKFAMARAPSPAREGACAPQTSEAATTFTRRLPARLEYLLLLEAAGCIWRKPG